MNSNQPVIVKEKDIRRDGNDNMISGKRQARRDAGWPSGRQWRKIRKSAKYSLADVAKNGIIGIDPIDL